ncbi:hypothetical protein E2I00_009957, partial [Balaenoptera physalus]
AQLHSPRASLQPSVAMETSGTTREQARKRALGRRPRLSAAAWTQARRHLTRPVRAGADAGVSGTWPRASVPAWPELAPGERLHPGGLSLARLGGQRRGCRIPDGLAERQAPGRGRSRFSAIPGHRDCCLGTAAVPVHVVDSSVHNQNQPPENWAEALGVLLGAVVQIIFYMDGEIRSREEARAQGVAEAQAVASLALATARKVKKEPGWAAEVGSALKMENLDGWNDVEDEGDPLEPLVQKAGAKTRPRRKKQKKTPKQEPVPWKKSRGNHSHSSAFLEDLEADDAENMEMSEYIRSNKKPCAEAASPGVASESDQDGGPEGPPKKKAMGWASAKSPAPMRKKKKVSLGPVSYVLVDSEDTRKKPEIPKRGQGSRRDALYQEALRSPQPAESPASTSQGPKAKPQGSPHASSGENDNRSHLGCVNKWMKGEEQQGQVGTEEPEGTEGQMVAEQDPSAVEGEPLKANIGDTCGDRSWQSKPTDLSFV